MTPDHDEAIDRCRALLPAWFVPRMMDDWWVFGLAMADGRVLAIETITDVRQDASGNLWLDVELHNNVLVPDEGMKGRIVTAPTSRTKASVAVNHIMYAVELADT